MARRTATDNQGNVFEWREGAWRPILEDPGILGSAALGVAESVNTLGRGIGQIGASIGEELGISGSREFGQELATAQRTDLETIAPIVEDRPFSNIAGQALPFIAGAVGTSGLGIPAQIGLEGVLGGLGFGTLEERAQRGAIAAGGAATGFGVLGIAGRVSKRIRDGANQARAQRSLLARDNQVIPEGAPGSEAFGPTSVGGGQAGPVPQPTPSQARRILENAGQQIEGAGIENPVTLRAMQNLQRQGVIFEPGIATGNVAARQLIAGLKSSPLTSDIIQSEISQVNEQILNRTTLRALGEDIPDTRVAAFDDSTIARLGDQVDDSMTAIRENTPIVKVGAKEFEQIEAIGRDFQKKVTTTSEREVISKQIDNVLKELDKPGSTITTARYAQIRSQLRGAQRKANAASDVNAADTYGQLIEELDEMFKKSIEPGSEDFDKFRLATQRFRLIQALEKPGVISAGNVRAGALTRNLRKTFKGEFRGDKRAADTFEGDAFDSFRDLFDLAQGFEKIPNIINDSGTATRLQPLSILSNPIATGALLAARPLIRSAIRSAQPTF